MNNTTINNTNTNNTNISNSIMINRLLTLFETYNVLYTNHKTYIDEMAITLNSNNILTKTNNICKEDTMNIKEDTMNIKEDTMNIKEVIMNIEDKNNNFISNKNTKTMTILNNYDFIMNEINEIINTNDYKSAYKYFKILKLNIFNNLIAEILEHSPKTDVSITKFNNIKTTLYPYQINNINWMIDIENRNYTDEYSDIKNKIIFKGGGLFDEVGMGKTVQIIALSNHNKSKYISKIKNKKIYSKATLIIVPNHLCGQWEREFEKHLEKPIIIRKLLTKRHYNKFTCYDFINADIIIVNANFIFNCKLNHREQINPLLNFKNIFNTAVNMFNLYWHRVVIDEYHEIENSALFEKLKFLESDYRWIISGTPFKEHCINNLTNLNETSLSSIMDYLTLNTNIINNINFEDVNNYNYVKYHFSRNTHNKNMTILKLPEIKEEPIWLNFTEIERMFYNAYLADPRNSPYDIFLRQICCHPMLSERIRNNMNTSRLASLTDMQEHIKKIYFEDFDKANEQYNDCLNKIKKCKIELKRLENENKKTLLIYNDTCNDLRRFTTQLPELQQIKEGKEKTLTYYKTFLELISDMKNITQQDCPICLNSIDENDLGITICGHIYCYSCISIIIREKLTGSNKCPNCDKTIKMADIFLISKNKSTDVDKLGTKIAYIINYIKTTPNKYRIIFSQWDYLLKEVGKILEENNIKTLYCQGNVYQKDKILRLFNDKNIINNEYKIIMLSSDSVVSGSNLNNAEEVIFLDPVYGDKQYRLNTENQAIGRVRRLGNNFKEIKVIRLLIKDSIEEEIFKNNTD
jgi:SNF2 family DNA or RNA helicase